MTDRIFTNFLGAPVEWDAQFTNLHVVRFLGLEVFHSLGEMYLEDDQRGLTKETSFTDNRGATPIEWIMHRYRTRDHCLHLMHDLMVSSLPRMDRRVKQ